ncbi:MAG: GyrI-like domain-containing protein, partial [Bacteroidota bacterium]
AIEPSGEIKSIELSPGKCVVGRYEISFFQFRNAWVEIYQWLESKNLQKSGDAFEVYQNNSSQHPQKKTIIDICIPID